METGVVDVSHDRKRRVCVCPKEGNEKRSTLRIICDFLKWDTLERIHDKHIRNKRFGLGYESKINQNNKTLQGFKYCNRTNFRTRFKFRIFRTIGGKYEI